MAPTARAAAYWVTSRIVALLQFWALFVGVCVVLLWRTVKCIYKHARRTLKSIFAPQPDWATSRATALPEIWALVAEHSGVVGAWRLTGVCVAAREGAKVWLRTLPGLVVTGGNHMERSEEVWRLDLAELRWERMASLTRGRHQHACCAVRGGVVVLGGRFTNEDDVTESDLDSVEILGYDSEESIVLPPLSCGLISDSAAIAIEESESEQGQVLLIEGEFDYQDSTAAVQKVDLATGVCTPLPSLLSHHGILAGCSAARLPDGRVVCVGGGYGTPQVLEPPEHGSPSEASWQWRYLPDMSVGRVNGRGCVLSDGRFAVFGGWDGDNDTERRSSEVLTLDGDAERWEPLPPMHDAREYFACAAIGGCVITAGGYGGWTAAGSDALITAEVYEEALGRWRRLPGNLPHHATYYRERGGVGSALM
jgi:hypothetical protein